MLYYERLDAIILGGSDKVAQKAACVTLLHFVKHLIQESHAVLIEYFAPKVIGLFVKTRSFHFELTRCLILILDYCGNKYFVGCLTEILNKASEIILNEKLPTYQDKIESCCLLTVLGWNLDSVADLVFKYYYKDVLATLNEATKHRVAKVQNAARNAKIAWTELQKKGQELADSKAEIEHLGADGVTPDDLVKVKSGNGNVADAKTLGYLKKRRAKKNSK